MKGEVEKYLSLTGQTEQELFQGAMTFGMPFILEELVPKALKENKKIVWSSKLIDGQDLGVAEYSLQDL